MLLPTFSFLEDCNLDLHNLPVNLFALLLSFLYGEQVLILPFIMFACCACVVASNKKTRNYTIDID